MAFTRAFLRGLGIDDDKVGAIMEAHVEVTDQLKAQRDAFKVDADKYEAAKNELDSVKADDWKSKHDALQGEFDQFKADLKAAETKKNQIGAYRDAMKAAGISEKHFEKIMRLADVSGVEFNKDGSVKNADGLAEAVKKEWGEYVTEVRNDPAPVATPPKNDGGSVTKEQFNRMGYQERLKLYHDNPELYNELK